MTNEVLQQFAQIVSDILDTKLQSELQPIRADIQEMKIDIRNLKIDVEGLKADVEGLKADVAELKVDVAELKVNVAELKADVAELKADVVELKVAIKELDCRVTSVELHIENETDKHIQIVAENHINLSKKLDEAIPAANKQSVYELKVDYLIKTVDQLKTDVAELQAKMA